MAQDRILRAGTIVLRMATVINWIVVALFVVALVLSFVSGDLVLARLATKYRGQPSAPILHVMQVMLVAGLFACAAAHAIFTRLLAIVGTVRDGDPFVAANARRLTGIGWALLVIQLLDLGLGAVTGWFSSIGVEHATWTPSFGGWIALLMVFVLARVFTIGTRMRDELEMTV